MNWQINYNLHDLLRMVVIICGYLLIRPYFQKWASRKQIMDYENKHDCSENCDNLNEEIQSTLEEETLVWGAVCRKQQKKKSSNSIKDI